MSSGNSWCCILVVNADDNLCGTTVMGGEFSWQCFVASGGGGGVDI